LGLRLAALRPRNANFKLTDEAVCPVTASIAAHDPEGREGLDFSVDDHDIDSFSYIYPLPFMGYE